MEVPAPQNLEFLRLAAARSIRRRYGRLPGPGKRCTWGNIGRAFSHSLFFLKE